MTRSARLLAFAVVLLGSAGLGADTVVLRDGDRISGRIVAKGTRRIRLQTPYGLLAIPRDRIEKIVRDDGSEEPMRTASASPSPAPLPLRLVVAVTGASFWQAWDPKAGTPADPSLRLEVRLDGRPAAYFIDSVLDPEDIPGAVVNTFSFTPDSLAFVPVSPAELAAPVIEPGRISFELRLAVDRAGPRNLWVAYQVNDGSVAEPSWRDVVGSSAEIVLRAEAPARVALEQGRGRMEFSGFGKRRMKNVDTFRVVASSE
jgi:hypothetical protein